MAQHTRRQEQQRAQQRVRELYDWEYVVDQYERLFAKMSGTPLPGTDPAQPVATTSVETVQQIISR